MSPNRSALGSTAGWEAGADLIVVGTGVAGLTAALDAVEKLLEGLDARVRRQARAARSRSPKAARRAA